MQALFGARTAKPDAAMPKPIKPLSPSEVTNAKRQAEPYKLRDGGGLYLLVKPDGAKLWRLDYRRPVTSKRNTLSLGAYPEVPLKRARERREEARALLADGIDPGMQRKAEKAAGVERAANSLEVVVRAYQAMKARQRTEETAKRSTAWMVQHVFPHIGGRPVAEVEAPELLAVLQKLVRAGKLDSAERIRSELSAAFRYAIAAGIAKRDPAHDLRGALPRATKQHFASITEPAQIADLLHAIDGYSGDPVTLAALKLSPLLFQRPGEIRQMEWAELDLDAGEWRIPAAKQKLRKAEKESPRTLPHVVPLAPQATALLRELQPLTGRFRYVFVGKASRQRPMSENTVRLALRRLGYDNETMTAHGFRHMASTRLNELGWNPDAIERQLSHKDGNRIRGTYNQAQYMDERRHMMLAWADYLDALRINANVIPLSARRRA